MWLTNKNIKIWNKIVKPKNATCILSDPNQIHTSFFIDTDFACCSVWDVRQ